MLGPFYISRVKGMLSFEHISAHMLATSIKLIFCIKAITLNFEAIPKALKKFWPLLEY